MQVANVKITAGNGEWQDLEALVSAQLGTTFTFDSEKTYFLVNNSNSDIYLINTTDSISDLDAKKINGIRLGSYEQAGLIKEQGYVYCKCYTNVSTDLHIEEQA